MLFSTKNNQPASNQKLLNRMQAHNIPGVSIAVINDGELEWAASYFVVISARP
jgi:hypothetical protein